MCVCSQYYRLWCFPNKLQRSVCNFTIIYHMHTHIVRLRQNYEETLRENTHNHWDRNNAMKLYAFFLCLLPNALSHQLPVSLSLSLSPSLSLSSSLNQSPKCSFHDRVFSSVVGSVKTTTQCVWNKSSNW